ncbi:hypothetical protein AC069_01560 [Gardnerella vaginalis]|uniref:TOMM precursor leader peptide-binding protein n=1 Tax=Gardnerella vaginalis TaxID=2702 RepID=UPI000660DB97|nr:TOMM precursor leader peptide-binding protein [Gardnerella vaginalis]KMT47189.1 hypothetical protein AC069_01560 [Gardnerella vaginalis]
MIKISHGVQFVQDGDCVLVKSKGALCRLSGPDVQQILIPLLPELESGFDIKESTVVNILDSSKVQKVLGQLLEAKYLMLCNKAERITSNNESPESITSTPSLGVIGSESLYHELIDIFTPNFPTWTVRNLDLSKLQQIAECNIAIYVNHGIDDATTLSFADRMNTMHINYINVSIEEGTVKIGPYVTQGTGCLRCYNLRRLSNLTFAYEARLFSNASKIYANQEVQEISPQEAKFLSGILAKQCQQIVNASSSMFQSPLQERVLAFNLSTMQITVEEFYRNPRCSTCSCDNNHVSEIKQWSVNPFLKENNDDID